MKKHKLQTKKVAGKTWYYPCYLDEVSGDYISYRRNGVYVCFANKAEAEMWLGDAVLTEKASLTGDVARLQAINVKLLVVTAPPEQGALLHEALDICASQQDDTLWMKYKAQLERLQQQEIQKRKGAN